MVSGLLEVNFLKFIGHSMVDSIQISSVKTAISGLQSFGSHGEPTEPYREYLKVLKSLILNSKGILICC